MLKDKGERDEEQRQIAASNQKNYQALSKKLEEREKVIQEYAAHEKGFLEQISNLESSTKKIEGRLREKDERLSQQGQAMETEKTLA